jgi:hypothetical protein
MSCMSSPPQAKRFHSPVFFFDQIESAAQRSEYAGVLVKFLNRKAASKITELSCLTRQILIKFYKAGICLRAKFGCQNTEFAKKLLASLRCPAYFEWPDRLRIPLDAQRSVRVKNHTAGKKAGPQPAPPGCGLSTSATAETAAVSLQETIITRL